MTIFVAGAGGMIEAARAMRQQQRQLERMMAARAASRAARRTAHVLAEFDGPTHTDFACYHLCETCGFVSAKDSVRCPGCGHTAWLDLANLKLADALRDMEAEARLQPTRTSRVVSWAGCLMLMVAMLAALAVLRDELLISTEAEMFGSVVAVVSMIAAAVALPKPITWLMRRDPDRRQRPMRWHHPVLPDDVEVADTVCGAAALADDTKLVRAPLTGRPCLAWQVCVLFDTPGDARPPEWVLDEVQATSLRVGDRHVDAHRVLPHDLELEPISPEQLAEHIDLPRFLRERGLHETDGEFELFEAIIPVNAPVEATFHARADAPVVLTLLPEGTLEVDDATPVDATTAPVVESRSHPSRHDADAELEQEQEEEIGA